MRIQNFDKFYQTVIQECIKEIKNYAKSNGFESLECFQKKDINRKTIIAIYRNYQKKEIISSITI